MYQVCIVVIHRLRLWHLHISRAFYPPLQMLDYLYFLRAKQKHVMTTGTTSSQRAYEALRIVFNVWTAQDLGWSNIWHFAHERKEVLSQYLQAEQSKHQVGMTNIIQSQTSMNWSFAALSVLSIREVSVRFLAELTIATSNNPQQEFLNTLLEVIMTCLVLLLV